jgi:hypothetical protein
MAYKSLEMIAAQDAAEDVERRVALALGGMPESRIFGNGGLIAATMRASLIYKNALRDIWDLSQFDWVTMPEPSKKAYRDQVEQIAGNLLK